MEMEAPQSRCCSANIFTQLTLGGCTESAHHSPFQHQILHWDSHEFPPSPTTQNQKLSIMQQKPCQLGRTAGPSISALEKEEREVSHSLPSPWQSQI